MAMLKFKVLPEEGPSAEVVRVALALKDLGGSAHFSALLERLKFAALAESRELEITREELISILNERRSLNSVFDGYGCFYQPFGVDSYRWSLCSGNPIA